MCLIKYLFIYIFETRCRLPYKFQTMNDMEKNNLSCALFASSSSEGGGIRKFEFVAKTHFHLPLILFVSDGNSCRGVLEL